MNRLQQAGAIASASFAALSMSASVSSAAEPLAQFTAGKPGLHAPFANSAAVETWGKETLVAGYSWDTFSGTRADNDGLGILRYETTLDNGAPTVTPMSQTEDWVFSLTMSHYGTEKEDFYFVGKANENLPGEVRIFSLANTGDGNNFRLQLGPNNVLLADLGPMDSGTEGFHDITIHYQAASQSFDAWFDGAQVANDVSNPLITDYGIDYFSVDDYVDSIDKYRQIKIGQLAPAALEGDFNNDSVVNVTDIDLLCDEIFTPTGDNSFDVTGDSQVNSDDLTELVEGILGTNYGDTDVDSDVDLSDLGNLATSYGATSSVGWGQGDFDCDDDVDLSDLGNLATFYGNGQAQAYAEFSPRASQRSD
jgi:hypothetical protein